MANPADRTYKNFDVGIAVVPNASFPTSSNTGELETNPTDGFLWYYNALQTPQEAPLVGTTFVQTLTNKTLISPVLITPTADTITGIAGGPLTLTTVGGQPLDLFTSANGDINIIPGGTGVVNIGGSSIDLAGFTITGTDIFATVGTQATFQRNFVFDSGATNSLVNTNALAFLIESALNQNLNLTAQGTGNVNISSGGNISISSSSSTGIIQLENILQYGENNDTTSTGSGVVLTPVNSFTSIENAGLVSIGGITMGVAGQPFTLKNDTGNIITILNESGAVTASERIQTGTLGDIVLGIESSVSFIYDASISRWSIVGGSGGGGGSTIVITRDDFIGDGVTTSFTLSTIPIDINDTNVFISGVYQDKSGPTSYTLTGDVVTFSAPVAVGDTIEIMSGTNVPASTTANLTVDDFTGDGVTTSFTLSVNPLNIDNTLVYLSGIYQDKSAYTVTGTTLTFSAPPPNGIPIEVVIPQVLAIGVTSAALVTASNSGHTYLTGTNVQTQLDETDTELVVQQAEITALQAIITATQEEHSWELNGNYYRLTFPLTNIDSIFFAPRNITIHSVWIYNGTAGSSGTTTYDLKVANPGGGFTSILSTTGAIASTAASNIWTDSGVVVGPQTGVTKPVVATSAITAGQAIRFDVLSSMATPATDARIRIFYS